MHTGQFRSGSDHPKAIDLLERFASLRQLELGTLRLRPSGEILRNGRSRQEVSAFCVSCRKFRMLDVNSILKRTTTNCRCQRRRKYQEFDKEIVTILGERYDAMRQRCKIGSGAVNANYGNRGIKVRMTREGFIRSYATKVSVEELRKKEFDRIDNDGHYEIENLRLITSSQNKLNRRNTAFTKYKGRKITAHGLFDCLKSDYPEFSYSFGWTRRLAASGLSGEEILLRSRGRTKPKTE